MTVKSKLEVHLEHIVMPLGARMNAKQIQALIDNSDRLQRQAAVDRARTKIPFLLPDEETEARMWIDGELR